VAGFASIAFMVGKKQGRKDLRTEGKNQSKKTKSAADV